MSRKFIFDEMHQPFDDDAWVDPQRIAKVLSAVLSDHPLSMQRLHPLIDQIVSPEDGADTVSKLIARSGSPQSPLKAYNIFRGKRTFDGLVGLAVTLEGVTTRFRTSKRSQEQIFQDTTQVFAAVGIGGLETHLTVYRQTSSLSNSSSKVAIEPAGSLHDAREALAGIFGDPMKGYFTTGVRFSPVKSDGFGFVPKP